MDEDRKIRALAYGDPGSGKTTMMAKIAAMIGGRAAIVTTDSAWSVITQHPEANEIFDRYVYTGFAQLRAIAEAHDEGIPPFNEYETLLWDTTSQGVNLTLRGLVDDMPYDPKQQPHPLVEGWPQYRIVERGFTDTIARLNKSGMHILYTAHLREPSEKDRERQRFAIRPDMPGASFKVLAQEVNFLGWLYREHKEDVRKLQCKGSIQQTGKSQIPTVPEGTYLAEEIPRLLEKWIRP
jgi:hypothetical protein